MFKVGDKVKCVGDVDEYWITNRWAELVVEEVDNSVGQIKLKVLGHTEEIKKHHIGETWWVDSEDFIRLTEFKGNKHATVS